MSSISSVRNPQYPPSQWWWKEGSWCTPYHARMLELGTQARNLKSGTSLRSRMTHVLHISDQEPSTSSKSLLMTGGSWHTSYHTKILKFGVQVGNQISSTIMRSRMTHLLHVSERNPQCPPSHWWWWGCSWHTSIHARMMNFGTQAENPMSRRIMRSKMAHDLNVFCQEPSMSFKSLMMMGGSWHTSNWARDSKFGKNMWRHMWSWTNRSLGQRPSKAALHRS